MSNKIEVGVYYFPQYHVEPRNEEWHGKGWTEWELVKHAKPRFPGHQQPKVPLWGYLDEAKPETAEKQIAAAADHGIDAFIYDWYWYDNKPFLNRGLEEGFLQARNNDRLKFSLMWANHDWINIFPFKRNTNVTTLSSGKVNREQFKKATDYMIDTYFRHPSYWRVNGGLYVSFYEFSGLIQGLGGIPETIAALQDFRDRTRQAGLGELHLNVISFDPKGLPWEPDTAETAKTFGALGIDSATSYVMNDLVPINSFPTADYPTLAEMAPDGWKHYRELLDVPYFPNVSAGWDSSPRTVQSDVYDNLGYPYLPVLVGNTPHAFERSLNLAKQYLLEENAKPSVLTVNSWNEWTEGSYLEPDTINGPGYLEAIRNVFGSNK